MVLGFAKSIKQDISLDMNNEAIAKATAFNMALTEVVTFLSNFLDNRVSPESQELYTKLGSNQ